MNDDEDDANYDGLPGPETVEDADPLLSTFGCHEMEQAARAIVDAARQQRSWRVSISMELVDPFEDRSLYPPLNRYAQRGLFMLAMFGWLVPGDHNGEAFVKRTFVERLVEKASRG